MLIPYAAMRCAVLSSRMVLRGWVCGSRTPIPYPHTLCCVPHTACHTLAQYRATPKPYADTLCCDAVCGTEPAYRATRCA
eukprot:2274815-Rhodomonas_salina.1